jgi:perosamine synthetase
MHTFGHPVRMPELLEVCAAWSIPVVEDAAEALGSAIGDRACGTWGRVGVFSFNGNKIVTTGGGGALTTDDEVLAGRLRHLSTQAKIAHRWRTLHDDVGYNYRMPNINAALGLAQLERLDDLLARKRTIAATYAAAFSGGSAVEWLVEPPGTRSNYWLCCVKVPALRHVAVLESLHADAIGARPAWDLLSQAGLHEGAVLHEDAFARALFDTLVSLPSSPHLDEAAVRRVAEALLKVAQD